MSIRLRLQMQNPQTWWSALRASTRLPALLLALAALMPLSSAQAEYIALYDFTGAVNLTTTAQPSHDTFPYSSASSITMDPAVYLIRTTGGNGYPVPGVTAAGGASTPDVLSLASGFLEFTITPNVSTALGASFFEFDAGTLLGEDSFTVYAWAAGSLLGSVIVSSDTPTHFVFGLPAALYTTTSATTFRLYAVDGGNSGDRLVLDNIGVTTPEPASFAMLGTGLIGLAFFRMRKRRNVASTAV